MSNTSTQQELTVTKVAYVQSVVDTVTNAGLAKWASADAYEQGIHALAARLDFEPGNGEGNPKLAGQIADVAIKMSMEMGKEEEEKSPEKEREEYLSKMDDEEEKKATLAYWAACDKAAQGAQKLAMAQQGQNPGTNDSPGNSLTDAAAHDSVAAIDARHRPPGYAAGAPDRELGAEIGNKSEHPNKSEIGKTAEEILDSVLKEAMAQQGQNPGTNDSPGNSLTDAAMHDSVAAIDARHRPPGYAAGAPDRELGAEIGNKSEHPNKSEIGKTAKEKFEETVKQASMHPVFEKLSRDEQVQHCKTMMELPVEQKRAYLQKLSEAKA